MGMIPTTSSSLVVGSGRTLEGVPTMRAVVLGGYAGVVVTAGADRYFRRKAIFAVF